METRQGKSVFSGVAIGKLFIYKKAKQVVEKITIEDPAAEVARYMAAKAKAKEQLEMLKEKTMKDVGEAEAEIFEAHQMLLEDLDFVEGITGMIENDKVNAEYAVFVTGEQCAALFLSMDDDYMRGRAADVNDISSRLIAILSGTQVSAEAMPEPVIIMAEDLAPSETVQFEKDKILALVTQKGSANSHTAILARMMNIPCIVTADIDLDPELTGKDGIVDGFTGKIYIEPDEVTTAVMTEKKKREEERKLLLQSLKGLPTVTKSGKHIHLYSNIGSEEDVDAVLANDSEGIGLFRSEFLYLGRDTYPTEEEQFQVYMQQLYPNTARKLVPYIEDAADRLEYENSMMFDNYPDRIAVEQVVKEIIAVIQENEPALITMPEDTAASDRNKDQTWDSCMEEMIQIMLLGEMHHRRWRYQQMNRRNY